MLGAARCTAGRRAGVGGANGERGLREQMGQLASRRLWRQKVGTRPSLGPPDAGGGRPPPAASEAR